MKVRKSPAAGKGRPHQERSSSSDAALSRAPRLQIEKDSDSIDPALLRRALKESEEFNRTLIESSLDCIKILDLEGRLLSMSENGQKQLEISDIQSRLHTSWTDLWKPEDLDLVRTALREARNGGAGRFQAFCPTETGQPKWWDVVVTPIRGANGQVERLLVVSRDVTKQKRTQEALEVAGKRHEAQVRLFEGVAGTTPDFVYVFDPQGRFVYANRRLLEVWGMELAEVVGKTCRELGYEQWHHDMHMREIAHVIVTRQPIKGEVPFKAPRTGISGTYEYIFTPVVAPSGQVEWIAGTTRDVTQRKKAEEALRESEERLRLATEAVGMFSWECDVPARKIRWSANAAEVIGCGPEELPEELERGSFFVAPGEAYRLRKELEDSVRRGSQHFNWEFWGPGMDEQRRYWTAQGRMIFSEQGELLRILGVTQDVTELKRAEEALRESDRRFRQVVESLPQLVWTCQPDGRCDYLSPQWTAYTGLPEGPQLGYGWLEQVHPEERDWVLERWKAVAAKSQNGDLEFRVRRHDGIYRWFRSLAVPVYDESGRLTKWFGTSTDITEAREARMVLARNKAELENLVAERTAKLQELVEELEHFSYSITHDMRAPLRAMRGLAEIMVEPEGELSEEDRQRFIHRIITAAERMDGLITDALSYSRAMRQELPLAFVNVSKLLMGMLETYPEFQRPEVRITVQPDLPWVLGNEAGLTQCFSNLLGNALRFVRPEVRPEVRVYGEYRGCRDSGAGPGEQVRIWVEDNGVGISTSMLPRVFDMFSRGSNPQSGTGIGLALVRKVVDRMGGRVGVESDGVSGSRFWLELKSAPGARRSI